MKREQIGSELPRSLDRNQLIDLKKSAAVLGLSVSHIRRLYTSGKLPMPIKVGDRKLAYPAGVLIDLTSGSSNRGSDDDTHKQTAPQGSSRDPNRKQHRFSRL